VQGRTWNRTQTLVFSCLVTRATERRSEPERRERSKSFYSYSLVGEFSTDFYSGLVQGKCYHCFPHSLVTLVDVVGYRCMQRKKSLSFSFTRATSPSLRLGFPRHRGSARIIRSNCPTCFE
jgi:hypothetical protein